jgi:hypothetical protein
VALVARIIAPNIAVSKRRAARKKRKQWYVYRRSLKVRMSEKRLFTNQITASTELASVLNAIKVLVIKKFESVEETMSSRPTTVIRAEGRSKTAPPAVLVIVAEVNSFRCKSIITKRNKIAIAPT